MSNLIQQRPVYQGNLENVKVYSRFDLRSYLALLHESIKEETIFTKATESIHLLSEYLRNNHQQSRSFSWNQIRAWNRVSCTTSIDASSRFASSRTTRAIVFLDRSIKRIRRRRRSLRERRERERERCTARRRVFTSRLLMAFTTVEIRETRKPYSRW